MSKKKTWQLLNFFLLQVVEGERALGKDNHRIGKFDIRGIKPARAGDPQIEVTFEVDNNGVLQVTAKDLGRGASETITITNDQNRSVYMLYSRTPIYRTPIYREDKSPIPR